MTGPTVADLRATVVAHEHDEPRCCMCGAPGVEIPFSVLTTDLAGFCSEACRDECEAMEAESLAETLTRWEEWRR